MIETELDWLAKKSSPLQQPELVDEAVALMSHLLLQQQETTCFPPHLASLAPRCNTAELPLEPNNDQPGTFFSVTCNIQK